MPKAQRTTERRTPTSFTMKPATRRLIAERAKVWRRSQSSYLEELVYAEAGEPSTVRLPAYTPTPAELRAIEKGRASESLTLEEARTYVERLAAKGRSQKPRPRARKGA